MHHCDNMDRFLIVLSLIHLTFAGKKNLLFYVRKTHDSNVIITNKSIDYGSNDIDKKISNNTITPTSNVRLVKISKSGSGRARND
uniref:Secreted protein n=1 Tax=Elaeophora elaphi TaxID=1147741 RepID=A0A0R3S4I0_9BILA